MKAECPASNIREVVQDWDIKSGVETLKYEYECSVSGGTNYDSKHDLLASYDKEKDLNTAVPRLPVGTTAIRL